MKLPFTFKEFVKNPFAAIALLCIVGMGYLYIDANSARSEIQIANKSIIEDCRKSEQNKMDRISKLEDDVSDLQDKIIEWATFNNNE